MRAIEENVLCSQVAPHCAVKLWRGLRLGLSLRLRLGLSLRLRLGLGLRLRLKRPGFDFSLTLNWSPFKGYQAFCWA